jgi:hypothetical protein
MACRVFRIVILEVVEDTQMDTLDIVNFYRSNTSDPFVEAELTGDELQQAETNMDLTLLTNLGT